MTVKHTAELSGAIWMKWRSVPRYYINGVLIASEGQEEC